MNLRYAVVITIENGVEYETRIPKNWIIGDKFYCPRSMKVNVLDPENPVIGEWLEFSYVMLKEDLSDDENANKENFDNEFRNTESDCENERRKLLKRKHSVSSLVTGSESDVNDGSKTIRETAEESIGSPTEISTEIYRKSPVAFRSGSESPSKKVPTKMSSTTSTTVPKQILSESSSNMIPAKNEPLISVETSHSQHLSPNAKVSHRTVDNAQPTLENDSQRLLKQILEEVMNIKAMLSQETKNRQKSEARIQNNFDLVNKSILRNSKSSMQTLRSQFKLPIEEHDQVDAFDTFLSDNREYRRSLKKQLSQLGGRYTTKFRKAMRFIIRDVVLRDFSWDGQNGKKPFNDFEHINQLLKDAIYSSDRLDDLHADSIHSKLMVEYCKTAQMRFKAELKENKPEKSRPKRRQRQHESDDDYEYE